MQDYSTAKSRNISIAAGQVGSNQTQGQGTLPGMTNVQFPDNKPGSQGGKGGVKSSPAGFSGGVIPGKV